MMRPKVLDTPAAFSTGPAMTPVALQKNPLEDEGLLQDKDKNTADIKADLEAGVDDVELDSTKSSSKSDADLIGDGKNDPSKEDKREKYSGSRCASRAFATVGVLLFVGAAAFGVFYFKDDIQKLINKQSVGSSVALSNERNAANALVNSSALTLDILPPNVSLTTTYQPTQATPTVTPGAVATTTAVPSTTATPAVTTHVTTAPVTTSPATTAPVTTSPLTTAPATTAPVTTTHVTTAHVTTAPSTTASPTTKSPTTTAVTTSPPTTASPTSASPEEIDGLTPAPTVPTNATAHNTTNSTGNATTTTTASPNITTVFFTVTTAAPNATNKSTPGATSLTTSSPGPTLSTTSEPTTATVKTTNAPHATTPEPTTGTVEPLTTEAPALRTKAASPAPTVAPSDKFDVEALWESLEHPTTPAIATEGPTDLASVTNDEQGAPFH